MQSIRSAQELVNANLISKEEESELKRVIDTKIDEASELIKEIRTL